MPTFDTPLPVTATVELPIGELRVVATTRTDTVVEVRADPADRAPADAVRTEFSGTELRVTGAPLSLLQKLVPRTPGRSITVDIGLPTGSTLHAVTSYGGVFTDGALGACTVRTEYGDVRLDAATSAAVTVGYGQIRVTGPIDGDATLTADHGGIRVDRITGSAVLRSKHGPVRADALGGPADLTGAHGDIDVDVVEDDVRVRTAYGSVRLGRVSRGEIELTSSHGRFEIGVAEGTALWLDADTSGRVVNDLTARDDPSGFTGTVTVHARSREGDIVIRRA
ncbi:DUF4097 family beta strand repeat-containing protein [Pseudonocardia sp. NPDC049635]|uniref:DUF4097 family beta strand repeat-containing protein n=1 Tax=Pseudonocardia sp. NPDC049635 TaxID=3155506 RepID=UPI0033D32373